MALLSKMLVDHQRMKEGLATVITSQQPDNQIIEVRWIDSDDEKEGKEKDGKDKQDAPKP